MNHCYIITSDHHDTSRLFFLRVLRYVAWPCAHLCAAGCLDCSVVQRWPCKIMGRSTHRHQTVSKFPTYKNKHAKHNVQHTKIKHVIPTSKCQDHITWVKHVVPGMAVWPFAALVVPNEGHAQTEIVRACVFFIFRWATICAGSQQETDQIHCDGFAFESWRKMHHEFRYGMWTAFTCCTKMDGTRGHDSRVGLRVGAHVWLRCIWLVRDGFLSVEVVFIVGVGGGFEMCVCCSEVLC